MNTFIDLKEQELMDINGGGFGILIIQGLMVLGVAAVSIAVGVAIVYVAYKALDHLTNNN